MSSWLAGKKAGKPLIQESDYLLEMFHGEDLLIAGPNLLVDRPIVCTSSIL